MKREAIENQSAVFEQLIRGSAYLTICGRHEILVENYQKIIEYHERSIKLQSKKEVISISGEALLIMYFTREEMKISGLITKIEIAERL